MPCPRAEPAPDGALTRAFADGLPRGRLAGPLRAYRSVESTQAVARAWADAGAAEGSLVLADHQTAGRGRRGRTWAAPPGAALLVSVVLRPPVPVSRWAEVPLAAGCAVAEGLEAVAPVSATLKWPNDVLVGRRKLAGILAEGVAGGAAPPVILGIGVNVSQREADWPSELRDRAGSLAGLGVTVTRQALLAAILVRLNAWYEVLLHDGFGAVRAAWRRRGLLGGRVALPDGEGTAADLGPGGELLVRCDDGRVARLFAPAEGRLGGVEAGAP